MKMLKDQKKDEDQPDHIEDRRPDFWDQIKLLINRVLGDPREEIFEIFFEETLKSEDQIKIKDEEEDTRSLVFQSHWLNSI